MVLHVSRPDPIRKTPIALSDELPELLDLAAQLLRVDDAPQLFGVKLRIKLVIDANIVLSDLIFHVVKKQDPAARRALEELVSARVVEAIAPEFLEAEIQKHLPVIAAKHRRPIETFQEEWVRYRSVLKLIPAGDLPIVQSKEWEALKERDPKDLPYLRVLNAEEARAVVSHDADFPPSVRAADEVLIDLRTYARKKAVAVKIQVGAFSFTGMSTACVVELVKAAGRAARSAIRVPAVRFVAIAAVLVVIISPKAREKVFAVAGNLSDRAKDVWSTLGPAVLALMDEYTASNASAETAWSRAATKLPPA